MFNRKKDLDEVLENTLYTSLTNCAHDPTSITDLGTLLSKIPIAPRFAKILVVASKYDLLHYAIMMVACMSVSEIYDDASIKDKYKTTFEPIDEPDDEQDVDLITQIDRDRTKA